MAEALKFVDPQTIGPINDQVHRPQLCILIEAINQAPDGKFRYEGVDKFHGNVLQAARVLSGYPRGARDPDFQGFYNDDVAKIEENIYTRPIAETLTMISALAARIEALNPEIQFLRHPGAVGE